ncbi:hypothetical protein O6H91_11G113100 [Diphasiastrum complanatum]|uniref:Uncharacterized protein n=1 Tax=Diphasiastrum complanatum TaxID=34168 RepID=A0ACC2CCX7_DIPCM|nr:hypothetical protein O6H91_11G113100 [Diphasiastrum complanatum]
MMATTQEFYATALPPSHPPNMDANDEDGNLPDEDPIQAGKGTLSHAAFHVATTIATPAAYAPLPFAIASLGWPAGVVALVMGTIVTWYNSILLASLWRFDGKRRVRYRDLARAIFGEWGYRGVVLFQQISSLGNNITIQIAAGTSMKAIYVVYHTDHNITLQEFIIIFGVLQLALSQLPDIHSLRWFNGLCTLCTIGFTVTAITMSIYDGTKLDRSTVNYNLQGTTATKLFGILGALGTISFSFGDAMLPEIQATVREPTKKNMYKGIGMAYSIITITYWSLAFIGYWAFGSSVNPYLINSLTTPTWPIILANIFAIIQIAGCFQIYCRPTYELLEDKLLHRKESLLSLRNILSRILFTSIYTVLVTLVAAAIPFFSDFVALCGAIGFTPLDFILPALAYLKVRKPKNSFVWVVNISIMSIYLVVAVLGSIGAIRFIIQDTKNYKFFKNL